MSAKAGDSFLGQSSMVTENLQRMERQDEASKPMFEIALKRAVAAGVMQSYETVSRCHEPYCVLLDLFTDFFDFDGFCSRYGVASRFSETRTSGNRLGDWKRPLTYVRGPSITTLC